MTRKDIMHEIANKEPVARLESLAGSSGGPGILAALVTVLGVVLILTLSTITALQQSARDQKNTNTNANIAAEYAGLLASNDVLLAEIRAAVQAGPASTEAAILALINDNRRIHGCKPVETIAQLATAPTCTVVLATPTTPTTAPKPASAPATTTPKAPATTTTTTAPPAPKTEKTPPGLLKKLVDFLL